MRIEFANFRAKPKESAHWRALLKAHFVCRSSLPLRRFGIAFSEGPGPFLEAVFTFAEAGLRSRGFATKNPLRGNASSKKSPHRHHLAATPLVLSLQLGERTSADKRCDERRSPYLAVGPRQLGLLVSASLALPRTL
ncbi:unnamed protein product [Effrenium voratum]|nr:unnamed protein product [Effrenium voratum]